MSATACVTTRPGTPQELPAVLAPLFVECAKGEGAARAEAFEAGKSLGKAELEWLATSGRSWEVQVLDPLGQSLVQISREQDQVAVKGRLASRLPEFALTEEEFLEVDGHTVALRAQEVPCLLGFALPRAWLQSLARVRTRGERAHLRFEEEGRKIEVQVDRLSKSRGFGKVCATFHWSQYLGLVRSEMTWCHAPDKGGKKRVATLEGLEDVSLTWTAIDE